MDHFRSAETQPGLTHFAGEIQFTELQVSRCYKERPLKDSGCDRRLNYSLADHRRNMFYNFGRFVGRSRIIFGPSCCHATAEKRDNGQLPKGRLPEAGHVFHICSHQHLDGGFRSFGVPLAHSNFVIEVGYGGLLLLAGKPYLISSGKPRYRFRIFVADCANIYQRDTHCSVLLKLQEGQVSSSSYGAQIQGKRRHLGVIRVRFFFTFPNAQYVVVPM